MLKAIEAYLALRRATGFAMLNAEFLLGSFTAFAADEAGARSIPEEDGDISIQRLLHSDRRHLLGGHHQDIAVVRS